MTEDKLMAKTKKQLKEWIKINEEIAHFNLTWVDEVTKLCIVYNRLRREIDEAAISTKERVVNRLHCIITNPAMFKWIKYSLKIVESSLNIMGKQLDFTEEISRLFKLMRVENKTWNQMVPSFHDSETYENMSMEDLKVVLGRWTERNEMLQDWKKLMNLYAAEWDRQLKVECMKSNYNCTFLIDFLITFVTGNNT